MRRRPMREHPSEGLPPPLDSESEETRGDHLDRGGAATCPFCGILPRQIELGNRYALAFRDGYPLTEGHMLVIPRRHVGRVFQLEEEEFAFVWSLVAEVRKKLHTEMEADGFTVGINDGTAAGQTVAHAHVHVIPRR
jgi:diadenosine tetraphosphate (Ap4A) HIT family hydrolase